jgi:hypothetical protein
MVLNWELNRDTNIDIDMELDWEFNRDTNIDIDMELDIDIVLRVEIELNWKLRLSWIEIGIELNWKLKLKNATCMYGITMLHRMHDYECMNAWKCMIGLQFGRGVSQRQTKYWKIGHVVARAITCTHRNPLWRDRRRETYRNHGWGQYITSHTQYLQKREPWKILWYRSPLLGVSVLGKHWMFASVVNAFISFPFFFILSFFNPIFAWTALSGCRFTGNKFFSLPQFCLNCLHRLSISEVLIFA